MSNTENKLVVFFDTVGRLILGERVSDQTDDVKLTVKNPAVVHIQPNPQTGQLSLQILPMFFREFLADKTEPTIWKYNKSLITESNDITFDFKLQAQYQQLFTNTPAPTTQQPENNPEVIKLFDE